MDRGMTAGMLTELAKDVNRPIHLVEIEWPTLTVRLTDAAVNLTWNSQTWLASQYLGFSGLEESADLIIPRCTITLSGVDQSVVSLLLQDSYFNRPARLRKGFITDALQVVVDPKILVDGRLDRPIITTNPDDGTCVASIDIVSRLAAFETGTGRHTNNEDQQKFFPGDLGFQYVSSEAEQILNWGQVRKPTEDAVRGNGLRAG